MLLPNQNLEDRISALEERLEKFEKVFEENGKDLAQGITNNTKQLSNIVEVLSMLEIEFKED